MAIISDAGTPLISDPGYELVAKAIDEKIKVTSIPGPSAVISALISSGLSTSSFVFEGYATKKKESARNVLKKFTIWDENYHSVWISKEDRKIDADDCKNFRP